MVMLCFLLDLRTLSPPLLRDLKQSLLQLANFYAITSPRCHKSTKAKPLLDRIGLCYVFRDRISGSTEMKVAYRPSGNFSLRDFHHAVNNLPADAFVPEFNNNIAVSCCNVHLASVLSDKVLYSWGDNEDVGRKLIVISSCLLEDIDSVTKMALMDAADKCVSVAFMFNLYLLYQYTSPLESELPIGIIVTVVLFMSSGLIRDNVTCMYNTYNCPRVWKRNLRYERDSMPSTRSSEQVLFQNI